MTSYEIYWDDLTPEAQERLADLHHDNIDLSPLAIIDLEDEEDDEDEEGPGIVDVCLVKDQAGKRITLHLTTVSAMEFCDTNEAQLGQYTLSWYRVPADAWHQGRVQTHNVHTWHQPLPNL